MAGTTRVPAPVGRRLIFVGASCNNRCVFCPQATLGDASAASVAAETEAAAGLPVGFVGGEPTIHAELPHWIRRAHALGCRSVLLQTNGRRLAYPNFTAALADAGVDTLDISLHGSGREMHDYHSRVPASFAQTARGIRVAVRAGLRVGVTGVMTRSNVGHADEIVRLAAHLGVTAVHLALARPVGTAAVLFGRVIPRLQTAATGFADAARVAKQLGVRLVVSGAPLCALPGIEHLALEHHVEDGTIPEEKFAAPCQACALRPICPGTEPGYLAHFGAAELRAATGTTDHRAHAAHSLRDTAARFAGVGVLGPLPDSAGPIG